MSKEFWTSDLHGWHKNLTKGVTRWTGKEDQCRDFKTPEEMTDHIIDQINKYVGQDDILYHLGDWSFAGIENVWRLRKRIHCKIIHFIAGNHDQHIKKDKILPNCRYNYNGIIVDGVDPNDTLCQVLAQDLFSTYSLMDEITVNKTPIVMSHFPLEDWNHERHTVVHLHGHCHGRLATEKPYRLDVGIDNAYKLFGEYRPFSWEDITKLLKLKK